MAYGGGYFTTYTKKMPGTYVNFSSALKASSVLSDRGIVFFGDSLTWGASGVTTLSLSDLDTLQPILGYSQNADEMLKVREIFKHATKLHLYRLDNGGTKASNTYATAKYAGTRGNALTIIIASDPEHENKFVVYTALDGVIVDTQDNIGAITDLEANAYVDWKTNSELSENVGLVLSSGLNLSNGANGTGAVKASNSLAEAKYAGTWGNSISIAVAEDTEHTGKFVVSTKFGDTVVDSQDNIEAVTDLVANSYVDWKTQENSYQIGSDAPSGNNSAKLIVADTIPDDKVLLTTITHDLIGQYPALKFYGDDYAAVAVGKYIYKYYNIANSALDNWYREVVADADYNDEDEDTKIDLSTATYFNSNVQIGDFVRTVHEFRISDSPVAGTLADCKLIVSEYPNSETEITLTEALALNASAEVGKYIYQSANSSSLSVMNYSSLSAGANGTDGVKASNIYANAKYEGVFGNALSIVIAEDTDHAGKFVVSTKFGNAVVDTQSNIGSISDLEDNDYIEWEINIENSSTAGIALSLNAGTPLTGGTNGTVTGQSYQNMLDTAENYSFNILAYDGTDTTTKALFKAFTQRMREEIGANFQTVLYNYSADYEGIINVKNSSDLVPWVAGAEAGCAVNASIENMTYDGEKTVSANYTQTQLIMSMESGELVFHKVEDDYKVLKDINSLTTFTTLKGKKFGENTTIRVNDQIGNDVAVMFNNQIMGKVQNDSEGRLYVWDKINDIMQALATQRAISNYDSSDLRVFEIDGDSSAIGAEIKYTPLNILNKLYLTCIVA